MAGFVIVKKLDTVIQGMCGMEYLWDDQGKYERECIIFKDGELDYCDLIAETGYANRDSLSWYATSLAERNPGVSNVWKGICRDEKFLPRISPFRLVLRILGELKNILSLSRILPRGYVHRVASEVSNPIVFHSVAMRHSWSKHGSLYRDVLWGDLLEKVALQEHVVVLLNLIIDTPFVLQKLRECKFSQGNLRFIPVQAFGSISTLLRALHLSLSGRIEITSPCSFKHRNITDVLKRAVLAERWKGAIFANLHYYYRYRKMAHIFSPRRLFYTWENHAWEKMLIQAVRKEAPSCYLVGYQHGMIPLDYINFFPGKAEPQYAPYPDRIITTGKVPLELLQHFGNHPKEIFQVGCALRHPYIYRLPCKTDSLRSPLTIGVATPCRIEIMLKEIEMSLRVLSGKQHRVIVRTYPGIEHSVILKQFPEFYTSGFEFDNGTIENFIQECDIVIYTFTSVGPIAMSLGNPVIYLDTEKSVLEDPIFNTTTLKWCAQTAEELENCLNEIQSLKLDELNTNRKRARLYMEQYLYPVNDKTIQPFF